MSDQNKTLHFPKAGIDLSRAFDKQPNRNVGPGRSDYARSTPVGENVRGFESLTNRKRGGQRSGLSKFIPVPLVSGWVVQMIDIIVTSDAIAEA